MRPITVEFKAYVNAMTQTFESSDYSYNASTNKTTINLNCTGYIMPCVTVNINGTDYHVNGFIYDESFCVPGEINAGQELIIIVESPKYFYGQPKATGTELTRITNGFDKVPMVYLATPTKEVYETDYDLPASKRVTLSLFLLNEADFNNWKTTDHWDNVIESSYQMAERLCEVILQDQYVDRFLTKEITGYAKIGDLLPDGDPRANLFAENYSGVQLNISYDVKQNKICKLC